MTGSFHPSGQGPPLRGVSIKGASTVSEFKFSIGTALDLQQNQTSTFTASPKSPEQTPRSKRAKVLIDFNTSTTPMSFGSAASSPSNSSDSSDSSGCSESSESGSRPIAAGSPLDVKVPLRTLGTPSRPNQVTGIEASKDPFAFAKMAKEMAEVEERRLLSAQLHLLKAGFELQDQQEVTVTPIFTNPVLRRFEDRFSQYGFLGGMCDILDRGQSSAQPSPTSPEDPRLFFNIAAPSSAFICGSQGSGKSHTLSCLLENCLMKSDVSKLQKPLAGLVFHYDSFTSDVKGTPCEAAYLASNKNIKVRILCSPTNLQTIKRTYANLNVEVEPLRINQSDLTTRRMLDLMAVKPENGPMPLYLHVINRILRELRIEQQETNQSFNYAKFKKLVAESKMSEAQIGPLTQRLDTLESFMPAWQTETNEKLAKEIRKKASQVGGNDWSVKPGSLTIVDLSCPCITAEGACALFNICLSLFLEQKTTTGRVIALDEAHKYMNDTTDANSLTNTLLSTIRLQRHLGARVFISTQEPTISPKLLDLCSITIVHRFSSPDWLRCLRLHLAALDHEDEDVGQKVNVRTVFNKIVRLRVGEALLFAPSAIVEIDQAGDAEADTEAEAEPASRSDEIQVRKLGVDYLKIRIRARVTQDGGKSVLAN